VKSEISKCIASNFSEKRKRGKEEKEKNEEEEEEEEEEELANNILNDIAP
jgi:ribosomal protein L12E/L44/L45/RPP1/RPP2